MRSPLVQPALLGKTVAGFMFALTSSGVHGYERLPRTLAGLSPGHFASNATLVPDPSGLSLMFSTQGGYPHTRWVTGAHVADAHLRALVDRTPGRVTWQVWHDLVTASRPQHVAIVTYSAGGKRQIAQPIRMAQWLEERPPADAVGMCSHFRRVAFELLSRSCAKLPPPMPQAPASPGMSASRVKPGAQSPAVSPAEAAGLVQAFDEWRKRAGKASETD